MEGFLILSIGIFGIRVGDTSTCSTYTSLEEETDMLSKRKESMRPRNAAEKKLVVQ